MKVHNMESFSESIAYTGFLLEITIQAGIFGLFIVLRIIE